MSTANFQSTSLKNANTEEKVLGVDEVGLTMRNGSRVQAQYHAFIFISEGNVLSSVLSDIKR